MRYEFDYYKEEDYDEILELVLASYKWENPVVGLGRVEFSRGLHPAFTGYKKAWEHTIGVYREEGKIIACIWNEGTYDGEVFFLFDSQERAQEKGLLMEMITYAKTYGAAVKEDGITRYVNIFIPEWNETLKALVLEHGFTKKKWADPQNILPFDQKMEVKLPEGYSIIDGNTTPDFYLSNIHRLAFGYGKESYACEHGEEAFHNLRQMKHYNKNLDLCVIDEKKNPVAIAMIWYDETMPYCELEPLGVVWWERRKGIGTTILHEAANRVMTMYPKCQGMLGSSQAFYGSIGYEKKSESTPYRWETQVFISWDSRSLEQDYRKALQ